MELFMTSCFFLYVKEALQGSIVVDTKSLENSYHKFAVLLFSQSTASCKVEFRNTLVYTRVEFDNFAPVSEKKCSRLCEQSHSVNQ